MTSSMRYVLSFCAVTFFLLWAALLTSMLGYGRSHVASLPTLERNETVVVVTKPLSCWYKFDRYLASTWESEWTTNIAKYQDSVCEHSNSRPDLIDIWVDTIGKLSEKQVTEADPNVFSRLFFKNTCTGEVLVDYVEPLEGLNRHPYFCKYGGDHVVNKGYIWVSWNLLATTQPSLDHFSGTVKTKSYYFDLGASVYDEGAGGTSQQWFVEEYEKRGIQWDGIYCWEAKEWSPAEVWRRLPARLRPVYHWYNVPTNPDRGHADNAIEILQKVAKVEDFVLVKIDIDNTPIEESFIHQIMASNEIMALIDELYFEHHVNVGPMNPYHATQNAPQKLEDTYRIFTTLRQHGIRAHQWV